METVAYRRHEPEKTVLYRIVQEHWKTFFRFAENRDPHGNGLPRYVRNAFEEFLRCGILQHGLNRVRCPGWPNIQSLKPVGEFLHPAAGA